MLLKSPSEVPIAKRWTRAEYHHLGKEGWFDDQRTELIAGEIFIISPQSSPHYRAICKVIDALEEIFDEGFWVRGQGPLAIDDDSELEPDVSVVKGSYDDYDDHPANALLVVEVSRTSLRLDRGAKAELYARTGIPECWVLNIGQRLLEVFRDPTMAGGAWQYSSQAALAENAEVSPLAMPDHAIAVSSLLP
jgi:Uma2 family endonuclease